MSRLRFKALVFRVLVLASVLMTMDCSTEDKADAKPIHGSALFRMGQRYKKPFWRLVGKAIMDLDCRGNNCGSWGKWSPCEVYPGAGQFGVQRRVRLCGSKTACGSETTAYNETDIQMCQDFCPTDYELTPGGFCLKFYNKTQLSKPSAETNCQTNGGHLININSPAKWKAFAGLMQKYGYTNGVYIDGSRKNTKAPWEFSYETDVSGYTNWYSSEPNDGSAELCLYGYYPSSASAHGIGDTSCSSNRFYVCENVPTM